MSKNTKPIRSRIGTCRSGRKFDVPHDLNESNMEEFFKDLSVPDLMDIFCMSEALLAQLRYSPTRFVEDGILSELNSYLREIKRMNRIQPELQKLGLYTSPSYVRFGKELLLVKHD